MINPVSPAEAVPLKKSLMPDGVITAWNTLIAKKLSNGRANIRQNEAIDEIMANTGATRAEVFANHWLDIEMIYRAEGWSVVYDKPSYCEDYEANFTFKAKG